MKICLLAAGSGTRAPCFKGLHKALLPLGNRAVISRIIEQFNKNDTFIIALGSKASQLRSYLEYVHYDVNFEFIYVNNFDGIGSGPGQSLLECKDLLNEPFIFTSIDTLVDDVPKELNENWIGTSTHIVGEYCRVWKYKTGYISLLRGDKGDVFTGIAGIKDHQLFWESLSNNRIENGEFQVTNALKKLPNIKLYYHQNWIDTGNKKSYEIARSSFKDVVEAKDDEILLIENKKVVKIFQDPLRGFQRLKRTKSLIDLVPKTYDLGQGMYGYDYINGIRLSDVDDPQIRNKFWKFCEDFLKPVSDYDKINFIKNCYIMYCEKTYDRSINNDFSDYEHIVINDVSCEPISKLLLKIPWDEIYKSSIPYKFHGDFQPENIIWDGSKFVLLDWRESFGDSFEIGDVYYDLSKLHHALIVNGEIVRKKKFKVIGSNDNFFVTIEQKQELIPILYEFNDFCKKKNFDLKLVELLSALTYINIASKHLGEYKKFLSLFGRLQLMKALENYGSSSSC